MTCDWVSLVRYNLAEPHPRVEFARQVVNNFHRIIKNVTPVVGHQFIVVVAGVSTKGFNSRVGQCELNIPFKKFSMVPGHICVAKGNEPAVPKPKLGPIITWYREITSPHAA